jgi:hypothetical protein
VEQELFVGLLDYIDLDIDGSFAWFESVWKGFDLEIMEKFMNFLGVLEDFLRLKTKMIFLRV